jgi:ATP-dependent RNA helicase DBP3
MVNLEVLQAEELVVKKNKKNKKRKHEDDRKQSEAALDENLNPELKKKKKKKKNKENDEVVEQQVPTETSDDEPKKKKKKKNKDKLEDAPVDKESDDSGSEDSGPFKKKFYTMTAKTEAMSKADTKEYQAKHNITMFGKGRKKFKPLQTFAELGFPDTIMKICSGFSHPTPIQAQCWPVLASGRDIIGIAETGSGKTLAFSIPALAHLKHRVETEGRSKAGFPKMLIVSPTRELAMQSQEVLEAAGSSCGVRSVCVYGGVPKWTQKEALKKGVEVVVATPGRLIDLINEGVCDLSQVSYLVLDEADRMLDQGFERDIRAIIGQTHTSRQTALFSATWPDSVRELAHSFLTRPIKVTIGSDDLAAGTRIKQIVEVVEDRAREGKLTQLLKKYHSDRKNRILIFVLYKKEAARIESSLSNKGWRVGSIHGDKSQEGRTQAVEQFKSGVVPLLVATDVAARGLDIPGVDYVINYSFPLTIEDYVHRIGRTGRAGRDGTAHTFFQLCDKLRAGELVKVLKDANQEVPAAMNDFDLNIKKKEHKLYGAFGPKDYGVPMKKATKITFD